MLGWMLDGSWIDFWWILGPSWEASWGQVGSKIDQNGVQDEIQKQSRKRKAWPFFWGGIDVGPGTPWGGGFRGRGTKPYYLNTPWAKARRIILTRHHAILQNHQSRSGVPPLTSWTQYFGGMFLERQHR